MNHDVRQDLPETSLPTPPVLLSVNYARSQQHPIRHIEGVSEEPERQQQQRGHHIASEERKGCEFGPGHDLSVQFSCLGRR